ncbi:hypothetical protein C8Q74DRAFT_1252916 [Fomes fomentarius]|nr:hypothetical protein C8Q74DRAFT_1252916 [Fomes fomentarius]
MYSTLVSVALFAALSIQGALAEFTVHTPAEITTCDPLKLSWDAVTGTKNYNVALVSSADPCETVLADLGDHSGTHITWDPKGLKAGDQVLISVLADDSDEGWSGAVTVKECAKSSAASSAVSASSAAPASTGTTYVARFSLPCTHEF